jgi:hypothetical protein
MGRPGAESRSADADVVQWGQIAVEKTLRPAGFGPNNEKKWMASVVDTMMMALAVHCTG